MTRAKVLGLVRLLFICFPLLLTLPLSADSLRDAYKAYEKGQYEEAAKAFQSHAQKEPEDYDQLYNTGVASFQKGAREEAVSYFDRAMKSADPQLKSRSAYNKGVAYGQQQRWDEAEAAFQDALSYDNDNTMIQENLQFAREQKNRQKKQESQQNQANQDPNQNKREQDKDANTEQKQAQNQSGKAPNEQDQKQESAEKQPGQPQKSENGPAQEQKLAEQKGQASHPENREPNDAAQKDKQGNLAQNQDSQREARAQKGTSQQPLEEQAGQDKSNQRVLTVKDLKKQEAEKLLRSVDDRIGSYILTPEQANTEGKSSNGKDW